MTPDRHVVIAIYGVGNPAPGEVARAVRSNVAAIASVPIDVREFDWNGFVPHAPRAEGRTWQYARWFSRSFVAAAWCRTAHPARLERVRTLVDGIVHLLWAATQGLVVVLLLMGAALSLLATLSELLAPWTRPMSTVGIVPAGVGWRSSVVGQQSLALAIATLRYGSLATLTGILLSGGLALVEGIASRSTRPVAVTLRRHALIVLLVPCVLLSLVAFQREDREPLWDWKHLLMGTLMVGIGVSMLVALSVVMGGVRQAMVWYLAPTGGFLALGLSWLLLNGLRSRIGRVWLAGAKVLLDIALYVGSPAYRATIQEQLARIVAAIPERSTTAIWIVAHSLGSVIALDSLTQSNAWQPSDRVRLITLGSPIRRFFVRFFPGLFFEPNVDAAAHAVAGRVGEFVWLNAFRRFDYIGTGLGFRAGGQDLPTGQAWPTHSDYWSDARVVQTVMAGWDCAMPIAASAAFSQPGSSGPTVRLPAALQAGFSRLSLAGGVLLLLTSVSAAFWLAGPGVQAMFVRPAMDVHTPVVTTARVRHERGFSGDFARMHEFTFAFTDDSTGREQRIVASVPGLFGVWSDPRFDYLALARFVRANCVPERSQRFFEFGWSVPCARDGLALVFDRTTPTRFRVIGFEYSPGLVARGVHFVLTLFSAVLVLAGLAVISLYVALMFVRLTALFAGDPQNLAGFRSAGSREEPGGDPSG